MLKNKINNIIVISIFTVLLFAIFLFLNHITQLWADDFCSYGLGIKDVIKTAYNDYFRWTGRVFTSLQIRFFLKSPSLIFIFNIFNSAMFVALIYMIFMCANSRFPSKKRDIVDLAVITSLVVCLCNAFAEVVLWKTGGIVYLWCMVFELFVLYVFLNKCVSDRSSMIIKVMFALFCFYSATCLEHASVAISFIVSCFWLDSLLNKKKLDNIYKCSILCHIAGFLFLISAPGNYARADIWFVTSPLIERVIKSFTEYGHLLLDFGWLVILVAAIILFITNPDVRNDHALRNTTKDENYDMKVIFQRGNTAYLFVFLSLLSSIALSIPGAEILGRTAFPSEVFLIIAIAFLFSKRSHNLFIDLSVLAISIISLGAVLYLISLASMQMYHQNMYRQSLMNVFRRNEVKLAPLPCYSFNKDEIGNMPLRWNFMRDIIENSDDWRCDCFAKANKLSKVIGVNAPVVLYDNLNDSLKSHVSINNKNFEIYVGKYGEQKILYYVFSGDCSSLSKETFFLHINPKKLKNIHPGKRQSGVDNLDFIFDKSHEAMLVDSNGVSVKSVCLIYCIIPNYIIKSITTGQYDTVTGKRSWEKKIDLNE